MQARFALSPGSNSVGDGFDHALRSHSWNHSRELVIGGIGQSTKLSRGAFPSPFITNMFKSISLLKDAEAANTTPGQVLLSGALVTIQFGDCDGQFLK
jgi:hypothetical protein